MSARRSTCDRLEVGSEAGEQGPRRGQLLEYFEQLLASYRDRGAGLKHRRRTLQSDEVGLIHKQRLDEQTFEPSLGTWHVVQNGTPGRLQRRNGLEQMLSANGTASPFWTAQPFASNTQ